MQGGQAREDIAQVGHRVEAPATAGLHDGVEDGRALAGLRRSDEQPVLPADGGGTDGVFHKVVVDFDAAVGEEAVERGPLVEGVGDGFAHRALREVTRADAPERGSDAAHQRGAVGGARGLAQIGSGVAGAQQCASIW